MSYAGLPRTRARKRKRYLTSIGYGRWWRYFHTRKRWKLMKKKIGPWWLVIVSYKRSGSKFG